MLKKTINELFQVDGRRLKTYEKRANSPFFRVVQVSTRGEHPQDFSYAPKPECCSRGRCNNEGEQVFYGSTSIATCINELKNVKVGDCLRVGRWEITEPLMYVNYFNQNNGAKTKESKMYDLFAEFFSNEGEKYYEHTIALTEIAFELNLRLSQTSSETRKVNAIVYPSTLKTNKNPVPLNIAIRKPFVDLNMRLICCWQYEITGINEGSYEYKKIASGMVDDGSIKWTRCESFSASTESDVTFKKDSEGWSVIEGTGVITENPIVKIDR